MRIGVVFPYFMDLKLEPTAVENIYAYLLVKIEAAGRERVGMQ